MTIVDACCLPLVVKMHKRSNNKNAGALPLPLTKQWIYVMGGSLSLGLILWIYTAAKCSALTQDKRFRLFPTEFQVRTREPATRTGYSIVFQHVSYGQRCPTLTTPPLPHNHNLCSLVTVTGHAVL